MEAIIHTEIGMPTIRTYVPKQWNTNLMVKDLDTLNELRGSVAIRIASYQRRLANSYNKRVKTRTFQPGNLVLRRVFENKVDPNARKFQPNWEGPYLVTRSSQSGSYALDKLNGTPVPRIWNATYLKRYYQ